MRNRLCRKKTWLIFNTTSVTIWSQFQKPIVCVGRTSFAWTRIDCKFRYVECSIKLSSSITQQTLTSAALHREWLWSIRYTCFNLFGASFIHSVHRQVERGRGSVGLDGFWRKLCQPTSPKPNRPIGKFDCNSCVSTCRGRSLCMFLTQYVEFKYLKLNFRCRPESINNTTKYL